MTDPPSQNTGTGMEADGGGRGLKNPPTDGAAQEVARKPPPPPEVDHAPVDADESDVHDESDDDDANDDEDDENTIPTYESTKNSRQAMEAFACIMNQNLQEAMDRTDASIEELKGRLSRLLLLRGGGGDGGDGGDGDDDDKEDEKDATAATKEDVEYHESLAPLYDFRGMVLATMAEDILNDIDSEHEHSSEEREGQEGRDDGEGDDGPAAVAPPASKGPTCTDRNDKESELEGARLLFQNAIIYYGMARDIVERMIAKKTQRAASAFAAAASAGSANKASSNYFWEELAGIHEHMGEAWKLSGSYGQAVQCYGECLDVRSKFLDAYEEELATSHEDLGDMCLLVARGKKEETSDDDGDEDYHRALAAFHYLGAARSIAQMIAIHCGSDPSIVPSGQEEGEQQQQQQVGAMQKGGTKTAGMKTTGEDDEEEEGAKEGGRTVKKTPLHIDEMDGIIAISNVLLEGNAIPGTEVFRLFEWLNNMAGKVGIASESMADCETSLEKKRKAASREEDSPPNGTSDSWADQEEAKPAAKLSRKTDAGGR